MAENNKMGTWSTFIEPTRNESVAVGTSNVNLCQASFLSTPRKTLVIRNVSTDATSEITIVLGNAVATAGSGIVLRQFDTYVESTDAGYECWQGPVNTICNNANGTLAIFER